MHKCAFNSGSLPLQAACAGTGVGSISISRDADGLPGLPAEFAGGHTLAEVHRPILTANRKHLRTQRQGGLRENQQGCFSSEFCAGLPAESHLIIESHVDHEHLSHHADPTRATRIVGVYATSEPHLVMKEGGVVSICYHQVISLTESRLSFLLHFLGH